MILVYPNLVFFYSGLTHIIYTYMYCYTWWPIWIETVE
jgi:hypothetical protein